MRRSWTSAGWPTLNGSGAFKNITERKKEKYKRVL